MPAQLFGCTAEPRPKIFHGLLRVGLKSRQVHIIQGACHVQPCVVAVTVHAASQRAYCLRIVLRLLVRRGVARHTLASRLYGMIWYPGGDFFHRPPSPVCSLSKISTHLFLPFFSVRLKLALFGLPKKRAWVQFIKFALQY